MNVVGLEQEANQGWERPLPRARTPRGLSPALIVNGDGLQCCKAERIGELQIRFPEEAAHVPKIKCLMGIYK